MLPQTTPDQRQRFYDDVESLLSPGFLTHPVVVNGVPLQLRSLGPGDLFMLRARAAGGMDAKWKLWALATSVWMIDGVSVLGQDHAVPKVAGYLRHLPSRSQDLLFNLILGLFARQDRAVETVEVYGYESISRFRWKSAGGVAGSGVAGAEQLGRNVVQRMWSAFNEIEDQRLADDTIWEGHKLVASSNAPKAIKKIDGKDRQRRQDEQDRRQKSLDEFYYRSVGVLGPVVRGDLTPLGMQVDGPKSVEDLESEMKQWVAGEQDDHDQIVADYKARVRRAADEATRQQEQQQALFRQERERREEAGFMSTAPTVGYTPQQLQAILSGQGRATGVRSIAAAPPPKERLYNRYIETPEANSGSLRVEGGRLVAEGANPEADRQALDSMIRQRAAEQMGGDN